MSDGGKGSGKLFTRTQKPHDEMQRLWDQIYSPKEVCGLCGREECENGPCPEGPSEAAAASSCRL